MPALKHLPKRCLRAVLAIAMIAVTFVTVTATQPATPAGALPATTDGYWMMTSNGGLMSFGGVGLYGAAPHMNGSAVAMAASPTSGGYWMVATDGGVFSYGDAPFYGSAGGIHLNKPIVGMAPTPDGHGYWLVASDGGIFSYGNAKFYGSAGSIHLNKPIVGMASTPDGHGYWLVASDGGIFSYGDASFLGSTGSMRLNKPIVGMSSLPNGHGYWLVASDGGIFSFGQAPFYGSTGSIHLNQPIVGMSTTATGSGYWLVASDGGIFSYGQAPFHGSNGGTPILHPVVAIVHGTGSLDSIESGANEGIGPYAPGASGYDISWPQCGGALPGDGQFGILGVNDGHAFSTNPCLAQQVGWAGSSHSLYINTNTPNGSSASEGDTGPAGNCAAGDLMCESYNYGWNSALSSVATVNGLHVQAAQWWLDVETGNHWSSNQAANAQVVKGNLDMLHSIGISVGIYSTSYQWGVITGGVNFGAPTWVPTGVDNFPNPASWCNPTHSFNGGTVWMIQYGRNGYDGDYAC